MKLNILKKIINKLKTKIVLIKTKNKFKKIKKINTVELNDYIIRGAKLSDLKKISPLYKQLNGVNLSFSNIELLKDCEEKLIFVSELNNNDQNPEIIGINMYYVNSRDFKERTIHEGFIGVLPEYEGKGIATSMRKQAITYFKESEFKGISSRISVDNLASLKSAEKLGFKPVEEYFDSSMQEKRYYLICDFREINDQ